DTTIANVALPHMQGALSATQDQISWVLTSYIVASAIMTPPTGYLASRFGRKRLFSVAVAGFVIASMLCGIAGSLVEMVLYPVPPHARSRSFDDFGLTMFSLAIGALQMLLDRRALKDWFSSTEIIVEAVLAALAFYLFVVHTLTTERPFIDPRALADRNLVIG